MIIFSLLVLLLHYANGQQNYTSPYERQDIAYFDQAIRSGHYVDKTSLLKTFIEYTSVNHHLFITSPKNFGKSTAMDMIRRFFHTPTDRTKPRPVDRLKTYYYHLFTNESLNLNVTRDAKFIKEHYGRYYVFYLSFAGITGKTSKQIVHSIRDFIKEVLNSHLWLYHIMKDTLHHRKRSFDNVLIHGFRKCIQKYGDQETTLDGLHGLLGFFAIYTESDIIVLIDDFDAPMMHAINLGVKVDEVNRFMQSILGVIYDVSIYYKIKHSMVVSEWRWFKDNSTVDIAGNVDFQYFQTNHRLDEYFGFTESQVQSLLTGRDVDNATVREYYNGYYIRNKTTPMYYPKGILDYLETDTFNPQEHSEHRTIRYLMTCLRHRTFFEKVLLLYLTEHFKIILPRQMDANDLNIFSEIARTNCSDFHPSTSYGTILLDNGYISYTTTKNTYRLSNRMMKEKLRREFLNFYQHFYGITVLNSLLAACLRCILNDDDTDVTTLFNLTNCWDNILQKYLYTNPILDEFQYQSIILSTIYFNIDAKVDITIAEMNKTKCKFSLATMPFTDNNRKTLVILRISTNMNIKSTLDRLQRLVPVEPQNTSTFKLIKYLVVNRDAENKIVVARGINRRDW